LGQEQIFLAKMSKIFIVFGEIKNNLILSKVIQFWETKEHRLIILHQEFLDHNYQKSLIKDNNPFIEEHRVESLNQALNYLENANGLIMCDTNLTGEKIIKAALIQGIPSMSVQSPFVEELLPQEFHLNEENTEKVLNFFIKNITKFELSSIKEHLLTHYD
jgi:hypothetical protein